VPSFEFHETMAGSFRLKSGEERAMSFTIRARSGSMLGFLHRPRVDIEGEVDAEGLADHRHMRGSLDFELLTRKKLVYVFGFTGNDDRPYTFTGEKTLRPDGFIESLTVLPGKIRDDSGAEVGEALLRFDLRSDLIKFIRSFRARA